MPLLNILGRRQPLRTSAELADFVDEQASFLVQKGIFEYARARAGHYAKVLFGESTFVEAVDRSRWRAYPLGLAMVAEAIEAALARDDAVDRVQRLSLLTDVALVAFDRHGTPLALGAEEWRRAREDLEHRLKLLALRGPKRVMDMPEPFAEAYFNLMPIHEKLRGSDFPTIKAYLKVTLCNIHDEFVRRADMPALISAMREAKPTR